MTERIAQSKRRLDLQLSSTFAELERAVAVVQAFLEEIRADEELAYRVVLLASEALTNAMKHGNKWQEEKLATLRLVAAERTIELTVTDEGSGLRLPVRDPLAEENLLDDHGRGLMFMHEMADEVHLTEGSNEVKLVFNWIG